MAADGVRREIISETLKTPGKPTLEAIKQELAWLRLELPPEGSLNRRKTAESGEAR